MALEARRRVGETPAPVSGPAGKRPLERWRRSLTILLGAVWAGFQLFIVWSPQPPLLQRPLHLAFAMALVFLTLPVAGRPSCWVRLADGTLLAAVVATAAYYALSSGRLLTRIELVDPVLPVDVFFGVLLLLLILEGVRRAVGWSLLSLMLIVLFYSWAGPWFPSWTRFRGFGLEEMIEILSMTTHGLLGITTDTSVRFVFYFIAFGAVYAAIGGGRLFIDIGLAVSGRRAGGAAKAAVVSSSLMGTISGSAVANVVSVGVFTIPMMRRAGYSREAAAGIEAISSTGGQLMPPVMGVAAFVMAELLQIDYARVAFAAVIPALAFYLGLFLVVDLTARKTGVGTPPAGSVARPAPILPRIYLLAPPLVLIALLVSGYSATIAVIAAIAACVVTGLLQRRNRLGVRGWLQAVEDLARQASQVAVPIAAIGVIMAVAIQSNLALKFSTRLIEEGGANIYIALVLTIIGCVVMGMGLPTVAAYIIGAILFAPSLIKLGIPTLAAHFFVMYYCVLSMVTPPVALASFAAAGLAGARTMQTGWEAFRLSLVLFLIPFGFAFDPRLLGQGEPLRIAIAFFSLLAATASWSVALVGYLRGRITAAERLLYGAIAAAIILFPSETRGWFAALAVLAVTLLCSLGLRRRMPAGR